MISKITFCVSLLLCATPLAFAQTVHTCGDNAVSLRDYIERGIACFEAGLYPAAVEDFTHALELQPNDVAIIAWRAHVYHDGLRAFDLAVADYSLILQIDPSNALAYHNRGFSYEQLGDHTQAIADYNNALQLDPNYGQTYGDRGLLYLTLGEDELALNDMTQAISFGYEPLDWLYQKRGQLYFEMGQYDLALNDFAAAINLVPQSGYYYHWRAYTYRRLEQYEAALADYNRALELNSTDSLAYAERGWIWLQLGEPELAMSDYNLALDFDPNNRNALVYRGDAYFQAADYDLALADYNRAVKIDAHYPDSYYGLGNVYYETGDHTRALDNYQQYLALVGEKANADIVARAQQLAQANSVWMMLLQGLVYGGALFIVIKVARTLWKLGFKLLVNRIGEKAKHEAQPQDEYLPDWLDTLATEPDSGD